MWQKLWFFIAFPIALYRTLTIVLLSEMSWLSYIVVKLMKIWWWHRLTNKNQIGKACFTNSWNTRRVFQPYLRFLRFFWSLLFWSRFRTRFSWCMRDNGSLKLSRFSWWYRLKNGSIFTRPIYRLLILIGSIRPLSLFNFIYPNFKPIFFKFRSITKLW